MQWENILFIQIESPADTYAIELLSRVKCTLKKRKQATVLCAHLWETEFFHCIIGASLVAQKVKNLTEMQETQETQIQPLGQE